MTCVHLTPKIMFYLHFSSTIGLCFRVFYIFKIFQVIYITAQCYVILAGCMKSDLQMVVITIGGTAGFLLAAAGLIALLFKPCGKFGK